MTKNRFNTRIKRKLSVPFTLLLDPVFLYFLFFFFIGSVLFCLLAILPFWQVYKLFETISLEKYSEIIFYNIKRRALI